MHKQVVYQSPRRTNPPPPPAPGPITQIGWKTPKYGLKHALHTLDGQIVCKNIRKISFKNFDF